MDMADAGGRRTPTLDTEWNDLTEDHRERRETLEGSINNWPENITQAAYVIGAIGAGKTQLLTHTFRYAYREAGKPALYVTMGQLLDDIEDEIGKFDETEVLSQERLHDIMESVVDARCTAIHEIVASGGDFDRDDYLLDCGLISDSEEYADALGIGSDEFESITGRNDEVILIVDEMEESYNRLGEMVAQTTGPLREVVERVESGNSSFYLIGGFGYASVHELGEAEYRRVNPITLPIIKPQSVIDVLDEEISTDRRNFVWWMSRGRPGWLEIANSGYGMQPDGARGCYEALAEIPNLDMSRVDIIALEELEEYVENLGTEERDQTALTIFRPTPIKIKTLPDIGAADFEASGSLLATDTELIALDEVADAFIDGAQRLDAYDDAVVSDQLVRRYLVRVLRAISTADNSLVFGAAHKPVFQRGTICKDRILDPLAERIHDIALEETSEEEQETIDFLYELSQYIQKADVEELSGDFGTFFDLFTESEELDESSYIGPGLRTLVTAFPSLITNPRLNFAGTGMSETEQFESVVEQLQSSGNADQRLREFGQLFQEDSP
jgi:hypothetical protein